MVETTLLQLESRVWDPNVFNVLAAHVLRTLLPQMPAFRRERAREQLLEAVSERSRPPTTYV